jgi:hypothetical protein
MLLQPINRIPQIIALHDREIIHGAINMPNNEKDPCVRLRLNDACSRTIHHMIFINSLPIVLARSSLRRDYVCPPRFIAELRENLVSLSSYRVS